MLTYADLRFLVVDDMLTMRKIIGQQLKALGVTMMQEANDGTVAWDLIQKASSGNMPFHFIVCDWNMPEMKGIELLKLCRSNPAFKDIAFLLVTAEAEASQVKEAILAGVDNYVIKPFTPQSFQEKMQAIFNKRFSGK